MTLKSFLRTKKQNTKIRIVYPTKIYVEGDKDQFEIDVKEKPHLFDVVSWHLEMENYEPIMVIYVK